MTKKNIALKKADLVADYKLLFESETGQRVLYDILKNCHFMTTSYQGDINDCIFREGERNAANYILVMLKQDPVALRQMIDKMEMEDMDYV
jgi:hypothetical protein